MTVETATYIHQLNPALPTGADAKSEGDNHLRLLKSTLQSTFGAYTGPITVTHNEVNQLSGLSSNLVSQLALKAPLASPVFSGSPTAPTATATDSSTRIATTAFVQAQKVSPAFTGVPTAPTPPVSSNGTQLATTQFVNLAVVAATGGVSRAKAYYYGSFS